jgi:hypothetical protein
LVYLLLIPPTAKTTIPARTPRDQDDDEELDESETPFCLAMLSH